ncbi:hypothetical protein C1H46_018139 [Malus baccata]|uniref:Pectinesterase n=1 Tax=Malus baccata TaxID=106549 RepID=A0A540MBW2_MALBA|nr:hypothetical protein C1H46_018139 [Malus baccata]
MPNLNSSPRPDGKRVGAQAVALRVSGNKAALYNCKLFGFQDTLCDDRGNHLFKDCYIEGTVDFIWGSGKSLYLNTELHVLGDNGITVITAQARDSDSEDTGYSFVHCKITGTGIGTYLGRAWRARPQVVYAYTNMTKVVNPAGWSNDNHSERDKTVSYGEYKCMGPGSSKNNKRNLSKELTDEQAKRFISLGYIQGSKWLLPPPNPKNSAPEPDGIREGAQAVALQISGNKAAFYNCKMIGYQDTLYDYKGLHLFKDCFIQGTVDFIFGKGKSLYLNTEIHVVERNLTVITAQQRDSASEDSGFSFVHCKITGTTYARRTYLGRAWGSSPNLVVAYTDIADIVHPERWSDFGHPERESNLFYPMESTTIGVKGQI